MAVVQLKIGPRFYKFSCNDGQELHMKELADTLDKKADQLTRSLGFMQEGQLLAMICLLLAEEKVLLERKNGLSDPSLSEEQTADLIMELAEKISALTDHLKA